MTWLLFVSFGLFVILGAPIAVSVGLASSVVLASSGVSLQASVQRIFTGVDSFPLMAIPFFMLAGNLMASGGISKRLIDLANSIIGFISGGLGVVTVLGCIFFGAISGSSTGTTAAIGSVMAPAMVDNKYDDGFSCALIAASGSLGTVIPPSIPMIIYGCAVGASISDLFIAGIGPGLFCGILLIIWVLVESRRKGYKGVEKSFSIREFAISFKSSILALLMPIIVLGGIYAGFFTPTEAASIACLYGFFIGMFVYHGFSYKEIPDILMTAVKNTATVMFIIASSSLFGWVLSLNKIPQQIAMWMLSITQSPIVMMLLILFLLVIVGTFMEGNAFIILLAPIFAPIVASMGMNLVQFGIVMVLAACVGVITPPMGVNLFTICGVYPIRIEKVIRAIIPFVVILIISLIIIAFVPGISMFLVNLI